MTAAVLNQHRADKPIEPLAILSNRRGLNIALLPQQLRFDFSKAPLNAPVHRDGARQERANAGGDFRVESTRIRSCDFHTRQFDWATGFQMLTPEATQLHGRIASLDLDLDQLALGGSSCRAPCLPWSRTTCTVIVRTLLRHPAHLIRRNVLTG